MALLGHAGNSHACCTYTRSQTTNHDTNQLLNGFCLGTGVPRHSSQGIGTFVCVYIRGTYQSSKFKVSLRPFMGYA